MKLFDTRTLNQNERFQRALILVIPISIVIGILYALVQRLLFSMEISVIFIMIGYLIANVILRVGRGAQPRFRYLAVICYILVILIGDVLIPSLLQGSDFLINIRWYVASLLSGFNGLISLLFRAIGGVIAYNQAI